jgi:hypothetical protein
MVTSVPYQLNSAHDNPINEANETNETNEFNEFNDNREDDAPQLPVGGR